MGCREDVAGGPKSVCCFRDSMQIEWLDLEGKMNSEGLQLAYLIVCPAQLVCSP